MAPNYANFFMDNFEQMQLLIFSKNWIDYHFWYSFVLLRIFSSYEPVTRTMTSKIKFKVHLLFSKIQLLDVTVSLKHGKLNTTLFTKPTDSHFYLV